MHCQQCGTDIPDSAAFCPGCGRRLTGAAGQTGAASDHGASNHGAAGPPAAQAGANPADAAGALPAGTAEQLQQRVAHVRDTRDVPEQELWRGSYSYKAMFGTLAAAALLAAIGLGLLFHFFSIVWARYLHLACLALLAGVVGVTMLRRRWGIRYRLTNQRFFHESGIFRRVTERIEVIDIDDMQYEQNLFERMFDVGSITISSTDKSVPKLWLQGIEHVAEVANLIDQARRAERNRRGLYIESS